MKKKKLKVVDLQDLQPHNTKSNTSQEQSNPVDEYASPKVDINQLDAHRVINQKNKDQRKEEKALSNTKTNKQSKTSLNTRKVNLSDTQDSRLKKYEGSGSAQSLANYMSNKYKFDKHKLKPLGPILAIVIFISGYFGFENPFEIEMSPDNLLALHGKVAEKTGNGLVSLYKNIYLFLMFIVLYIFPYKAKTKNMVEIFYDGLTIPSEIFPVGSATRKRISWPQIISIQFKSKRGVNFVQLFDAKKLLLAEMRIDVDNLKAFYVILDRYIPESNPLRALFDNSQNR